jgi:IclR family pca regulon transcriptional regulator
LQAKTSRTLHTPEDLWECLQQVRQQGWCVVDQELEQGLRSLAVPVYDSAGHVLAAMNVSTHAGRVPASELEKRFLPIMLNASRELSSQLFAPL